MLRSGNAVIYVVPPNGMDYRRFNNMRNAMKKAMENNRGIWNEANSMTEIPLKYRERMFGSASVEFIGDFSTDKYVPFSRMEEVAIEDRVIFFSLADAINANFVSADRVGGTGGAPFATPDGAYKFVIAWVERSDFANVMIARNIMETKIYRKKEVII